MYFCAESIEFDQNQTAFDSQWLPSLFSQSLTHFLLCGYPELCFFDLLPDYCMISSDTHVTALIL